MSQRIILIGPGSISRKYMEALAWLKGMEVVGVVGRDPDKTAAYAASYGIAHHGTDLARVIRESGPTMALVCTPNSLHFRPVMECAAAGLHVLCEKPLHMLPSRQEQMIRRCRQADRKLGVGYCYRFLPCLRFLKTAIEENRLGRILALDVRMKIWREPASYTASSWHGTPRIDGGGPFIQQATHLIDLALWLGNGFRGVLEARRFTLTHPIRVEDHGYGLVRYGCGAVGMIEASTACRGMNRQELEITGTEGSVTTDLAGILSWNVESLPLPEQIAKEKTGKDWLFRALLEDFRDAVESGREPFIDGRSGKQAVDLIHAIYRKSGKPEPMRPSS
jgi:UDP-N-acetyl-2-amino-2-deoxyglucuronate dehydrogenase